MKLLFSIIIIGQTLFLYIYNERCLFEYGNHTGIGFQGLGILSFVMSIFFLLLHYLNKKSNRQSKLIVLAGFLFLLIGVNVIVFDYLNIMVGYEAWLERGMPTKPFGLK